MADAELKTAIAFARLELLELEAGRRTLLQCPGIINVAKAIRTAARIAAMRGRRWSRISKAWIFAEDWNDREEVARLNEKVDALSQQLAAAQHEKAAACGLRDGHAATIAKLEQQLAAKDARIAELESALANGFCDLREEVLRLTEKLNAVKRDAERLAQIREDLKDEIRLRSERARANGESMRVQYDALLKHCADLVSMQPVRIVIEPNGVGELPVMLSDAPAKESSYAALSPPSHPSAKENNGE